MKHKLSTITLAVLAATSLNFAASAHANQVEEEVEVIEVTGIRTALASALAEKRSASGIKEIIQAEDIGKLPDNNLAEVLENVTGIQIQRSQGVGTSVQIRGTNDNRVEINGVSSVGAGSRTGVGFADLPAAIIASLEVIKSPNAKMIEGSVGGTVNLRTLRGNSLDERLLQFRAQVENSDLADSTTPRFSATFGDNWETEHGKVGLVLTGSYAQQEVASINPRYDRDGLVASDSGLDSAESFDYARIQYMVSPFTRDEYDTTNFTGSLEWEQSDNLKLYFDATINDQERLGISTVLQASGVSDGNVVNNADVFTFETRDMGSIDGENGVSDLGELTMATSGILYPSSREGSGSLNPNLRMEGSYSSRFTKTQVFAFGSEWSGDKLTVKGELSYADADQEGPSTDGYLDFINPHSQQPGPDNGNDNGTPLQYNSTGGFMEWGVAQGTSMSPSTSDMLNPHNYALKRVTQSNSYQNSEESAARVDFSYDVSEDMSFFTDIHAGVRINDVKTSRSEISDRANFNNWNRPRADLLGAAVAPGPDNFGDVDDRELFIPDYLVLNADMAHNDPAKFISLVNAGITANNALTGNDTALVGAADELTSRAFEINEDRTAFYLQADFELELGDVFVSGDLGVRHVSTDVSSIGNVTVEGVTSQETTKSDYSHTLPRFNVSAELTDDVIARFSVGKDIRRPGFSALSTSVSWGSSSTSAVNVGNPDLKPEEILSYDLSFEYYFAESSVASIGFFRKERDNLISSHQSAPAEFIGPTGLVEFHVDGDCSGGGIHNPNVGPGDYGIYSTRTDTQGMCVPLNTNANGTGTETQTGIELSFQGDLSSFEKELGWASGFGLIANATFQDASASGKDYQYGNSRGNAILGRTDGSETDADGNRIYETATNSDDVLSQRIVLPNLSETAYNITAYYDKNDLSVRLRYTWRDAYLNTERLRMSMSPYTGARGQLNLAVGYDINDMINVGISANNLTQSDTTNWCLNDGALLCNQVRTDRRITAGVTIKL